MKTSNQCWNRTNLKVQSHCDSDDSDESEESNSTTSDDSFPERVGNRDWCICQKCNLESRNIDCLCCQEEAAISQDKFEGKGCIIEAE